MPEAAQNNSKLDALKDYVGQQVNMTVERINKSDGKLEEALLKLEKTAPIEVVEQIRTLAKGLEGRVDDLEAGGFSLPSRSSGHSELRKALDSSNYVKELHKAEGAVRLLPNMPGAKIPSLVKMDLDLELQKVTVGSEATAQIPVYRPGLIEYLLERSRIAQRVNSVTIKGELWEYLYENKLSAEGGVVTEVSTAVEADDGTDIILADDGSINSVIPGKSQALVERTNGSGLFLGWGKYDVQSVNTSTRAVTMSATIGDDIAQGDRISFRRFKVTPEGVKKPYTYKRLDRKRIALKMIAIMAEVTRQAVLGMDSLEGFIKKGMQQTVNHDLSYMLYYGSGEDEVLGYLTSEDRQISNWSDGVSGDTMADAIMRSGYKIRGGSAECMIHSQDWINLISEKATDGHYIHGKDAPIAVINQPTLKAIGPYFVFEDDQIDQGDYLLNIPGRSSTLVRQKNSAQFLTGYINDDFEKNKYRMRYEEGMEHAIHSHQAYVHGKFDSRPS